MKLGVDARPLDFPNSGIGRYTSNILRELRAQTDWEIVLYAGGIDPDAWPGFSVRRVPGLSAPLIASIAAQVCLPWLAQRDEIDVFFSPRHHLPLGLSAPGVVTVHDVGWLHVPETMRLFGRILEQILMPPTVRKASAVIAVSDATRADLAALQCDERKVNVIYEAPGLAPSGSADGVAGEFILFVGTFEPRKNLERLLLAHRQLVLGGVTSVELVLAGNDGWKVDLDELVRNSGHAPRVRIERGVDDERLHALYEGCLFLAMPSLYEGFGLPVVEAMAHGKAVLVGDCPALREVAADAGFPVDPYSVDAIADGIASLLDAATREPVANEARARAQAFSWAAAGEATASVISAVAGERAMRARR